MTIHVMNAVWQHSQAKGGELLVLLSIADHARVEDGLAWPSIKTLARYSRMSERQVTRIITSLEARGELKVTRRRGKSNYYHVLVGMTSCQGSDEEEGSDTPVTTGGDTHVRGGVTPTSPTPDTAMADEPLVTITEPPVEPLVGETPTPDPPPRKPKRPIAVETFREAVHRYPATSWWEQVDQDVGLEEASLKLWYAVCHAWVGLGWNPTNVKGMLECFNRGEIPGSKGKATPRRPIGRVVSQEERDAWWAAEDELTKTLGRPPSSEEIKAHLEQQKAVKVAKGRL